MKRNYGISFSVRGRRVEDSTKRYTKKGALETVALIKKGQRMGLYLKFKNPRVIRAK